MECRKLLDIEMYDN